MDQGIDITKEEYDAVVSKSLLNREECSMELTSDSDLAIEKWNVFLAFFKSNGVILKKELMDKVHTWKHRKHSYIAIIFGTESQMTHCVALVSRKSDSAPLYINFVVTMAPVMTQPFCQIMVKTLEEIAKTTYNTTVIVPKEYRNTSEEVYEIEADQRVEN